MVSAIADTHTIIWYLYNDSRLSPAAGIAIDDAYKAGHEIYISSISLVETAYLVEKNRIPLDAFEVIVRDLNRPGTFMREQPVDTGVADTMRRVSRAKIPEMPDRIIAATALMLGVPVISRDHKITASAIQTIW